MATTVPIVLDTDWISKSFQQIGSGQLILDIGSSRGTWALDMCTSNSSINVLGLEIKAPLVQAALQSKEERKINNVHFLKGNIHIDIATILDSLRSSGVFVDTVTIQFPDPHWGNRNLKKRVINPTIVRTFAEYLQPGSTIFFHTDIEELAYDMAKHFAGSEHFTPAEGYTPQALQRNRPLYAVKTEREEFAVREGLPIYRMLYVRNKVIV